VKPKYVPAVVRILLVVALFAVPAALGGSPYKVDANDKVCTGLTSGKIDVSGDHTTLTLTAPDGYLISGYCVKAGSVNQDEGPEYYAVEPPAASVEISHSTGKAISHYSYTLVEDASEPCPPEDVFCASGD
jgi:hypothetical protein